MRFEVEAECKLTIGLLGTDQVPNFKKIIN
jgi:hypothetical protein